MRLLLRMLICFLGISVQVWSAEKDMYDDADIAYMKTHFGEQEFLPEGGLLLREGQHLPKLVWHNSKLVGTVLEDTKIPTQWFDADFNAVNVANKPGRYYVYGEAPAPQGPPLRRAMTCYCVPSDVDLRAIAEKTISVTTDVKEAAIDSVIQSWRTTEDGVVMLAGLIEEGEEPARVGQWHMENATRHVQLKRKLMGLDAQAPVSVGMRSISSQPAPVLRTGSLEEAQVTTAQVQALREKLDAWYEDAQQPTAVVVARHGVIVFEKGYGLLDDKPVTVDTPMLLHSAMKPLMGLQLAMYVDRGFVDLDDPMGQYLQDFNAERDQNLTFRAGHVHATGIHFPWSLAFKRLFYFHTWHESLIAHCPREWDPGAKHRYGVVGVILSVRALELMRGLNYWDAMERDLFNPLGIENIYPGGTGFSAENLARVGLLLDNKGKYGSWEAFSEETYHKIVPTDLTTYFPEINKTYGIGLQSYAERLGPNSYGHAGGCGTQLMVDPENHVVFAMVRNDRGEDYQSHFADVMALLKTWGAKHLGQ